MARSQRFSPIRRSTKRKFNWFGGTTPAPNLTNVAGQTSIIVSNLDTRLPTVPSAPFTIVRIRGVIVVQSDQQVLSEFPGGAYGIAVVNGEAFDAGVASIPTPWTESFDDRWLYHTYWFSPIVENPTTSDYQQSFQTLIIDGKAMRKVDVGDVVVAVFENASTFGVSLQSNFRVGAKLF